MSELFHTASGDWDQTGSKATFKDSSKQQTGQQTKTGNSDNMFGAGAMSPTAGSGGHGQPQRQAETALKIVADDEKVHEAKKANPFV